MVGQERQVVPKLGAHGAVVPKAKRPSTSNVNNNRFVKKNNVINNNNKNLRR